MSKISKKINLIFWKNPLTTTLIIGALGLQVYTVTILTLRVLSTNHGADLWENIDDFALGARQAIDLLKISIFKYEDKDECG